MKIELVGRSIPDTGSLIVFASKDGKLCKFAEELNNKTSGLVKRALDQQSRGQKPSGVIDLLLPAGLRLEHLLIAILPKASGMRARDLEELGGSIQSILKTLKIESARLSPLDGMATDLTSEYASQALTIGIALKNYRFERYRTMDHDDDNGARDKGKLKLLEIIVDDPAAEAMARRIEAVRAAVFHARDLVSEPANVLYPETFAKECLNLKKLGVGVEVLDRAKLEQLGMGALLGVGQGSVRPPYIAVMQWMNGGNATPLALVGKGVCFDTGGISIKPSGGMEDMKFDMGGAGAVFGVMKAIAGRKAKANVIGVLALAENMPSGTAQRPGDVVKSMSGKTIEVINTDAEGRLILADALHYTIDRFKPRAVIDLATLTGAVIMALGHEHAGLFANDDDLATKLTSAGENVGETLWRLPLGKGYDKHIKSSIADMKNVGRAREAGSTAGAVFLQRFVGDTPWAHLDIAGTAWTKQDLPTVPSGATGFGVRLLDRFIADFIES